MYCFPLGAQSMLGVTQTSIPEDLVLEESPHE